MEYRLAARGSIIECTRLVSMRTTHIKINIHIKNRQKPDFPRRKDLFELGLGIRAAILASF